MAAAGVDETRAIATFMEAVGRFAQVALLTDGEVRDLFGEETAAALVAFDRYQRGEWIFVHPVAVFAAER